jgi:hypothetical protein
MFGLSTVKLIGLAIAAAAILSFVLLAFHWKHQAADRKEQLATICAATRTVAANPKLACKAVPQQITLLGQAITDLKAGIAKQNAAIDAMGKESARQQADAAKAAQDARERARGAEATAERLRASAHSTQRLPGGVCEPSKAVQETWR